MDAKSSYLFDLRVEESPRTCFLFEWFQRRKRQEQSKMCLQSDSNFIRVCVECHVPTSRDKSYTIRIVSTFGANAATNCCFNSSSWGAWMHYMHPSVSLVSMYASATASMGRKECCDQPFGSGKDNRNSSAPRAACFCICRGFRRCWRVRSGNLGLQSQLRIRDQHTHSVKPTRQPHRARNAGLVQRTHLRDSFGYYDGRES